MTENVKEKALQILETLERSTNIYDLEVDGIKAWWFIRAYFYLQLIDFLSQGYSAKYLLKKKRVYRNYFKFFVGIFFVFLVRVTVGLFRLAFSNKFTDKKILFLVDDADFRLNNGKGMENHVFFADIYGKFRDYSNVVEVLTERSFSLKSLKKDEEILFSDFAYFFSILEHIRYVNRNKEIFGLKVFEEQLSSIDMDDEIKNWILVKARSLIKSFRLKIKLQIESAKIIIDKLKPCVIVETRSYNGSILAFNYIAKQKGIRILELQHGLISQSHIGYNYFVPMNYSGVLPIPDEVFLFGEFFKKAIVKQCNALSKDNLIVTGFPRISKFCSKSDSAKKEVRQNTRAKLGLKEYDFLVLITLQPLYEESLYKFLREVIPILPEHVFLCLKMHPSNSKKKAIHDEIKTDNRIFVIDDSMEELYALLVASDVHCTISSTVFLEALAIGVANIILELPGYESVLEIVNREDLIFVCSPEEFIAQIESLEKDVNMRDLFIMHGKALAERFFLTIDSEEIITTEIRKYLSFSHCEYN